MDRVAPGPAGAYTSLRELVEIRHQLRGLQLFSAPQRRGALVGLHRARLRGRGIDFDQVRVYQPGDDVRSIDWRVTARTQQPHTKLYHEERERPVYLLVEQSRALFFGTGGQFKSVLAAQAAALFGWAALDNHDRIGGLVFGGDSAPEVRLRRSKQSLLQLLSRVVDANHALRADMPGPGERFGSALRRAREVLRPGSLLVVICDERALDDAGEQQLTLLAQHVELILVPLSDPLDHALPAAGLLRFAEGARVLDVDTYDPLLRRAYRARGQARQARWQQLADKARALLLPLSSQHTLLDQLRDFNREAWS